MAPEATVTGQSLTDRLPRRKYPDARCASRPHTSRAWDRLVNAVPRISKYLIFKQLFSVAESNSVVTRAFRSVAQDAGGSAEADGRKRVPANCMIQPRRVRAKGTARWPGNGLWAILACTKER